jgi:hypothetical protein
MAFFFPKDSRYPVENIKQVFTIRVQNDELSSGLQTLFFSLQKPSSYPIQKVSSGY